MTNSSAHQNAGRLVEAGALGRKVLRAAPDHGVLYLLGVIDYQTDQPAESVELIRRALAP